MAGSVRQRGKQSWEIRAFAGKDAETGKKRYVTRTVRGDRREAEVALGRGPQSPSHGRATAHRPPQNACVNAAWCSKQKVLGWTGLILR